VLFGIVVFPGTFDVLPRIAGCIFSLVLETKLIEVFIRRRVDAIRFCVLQGFLPSMVIKFLIGHIIRELNKFVVIHAAVTSVISKINFTHIISLIVVLSVVNIYYSAIEHKNQMDFLRGDPRLPLLEELVPLETCHRSSLEFVKIVINKTIFVNYPTNNVSRSWGKVYIWNHD
jgi:hypothetical protein